MRMRPSLFCSSAAELLLFLFGSVTITGVRAINFTPVPSPNLDLGSLGRVALAGDFDSISLYSYEGQNQNGFSTNGSQALLSRYPNGAFASLSAADAYIESMCPFVMRNGSLAGVVVGGNFTSLGGVEAQGIALFNPDTAEITPLPGLNGRVASVFCDNEAETVYVGGSFAGGNSTNAIAWTTGWTNLPFAGFNGPVTSITKAGNGNIVFGGAFDSVGNTTTLQLKDQQVIPVTSANITASPSSGQPGLTDPRNIICKTGQQDGAGNSWLLADRNPGFWQASFEFGFQPTKLRLYNTRQQGRGTKTFRFTALPLGGIMNFTLQDSTGRTVACDARCPLPENNMTAQDFHFVNTVGMNGFRIDISEWYGDGAGLAGIELFQDDIYSFAINEFNEPACDGFSPSSATSTNTGPWRVTPSGTSTSEYLTADLNGQGIGPQSAQVVFRPNIKQSGNYSVTVFTPGCVQDNTCSTRGRVNITGIMGSESSRTATQPVTTELYQTNNFDKYDQVYFGYIDATSETFRPTVTLSPSAGQNGPLTVVAQRVRFELLSSTGGLNGLFEFNPSQAVIDTDFSKSAIDQAGMDLEAGALITALSGSNDRIFVGGNFSTNDFSNIFSLGSGNATSLANGGLNAEVLTMFRNGSVLYVGGNFSNTREGNVQGLNNVAMYSVTDNAWRPLGAGVNGIVWDIVPLTLNITANRPELVISVSGYFDEILGSADFEGSSARNIALWVPSSNNWLNNLNGSSIAVSGQLTAQTDIPGYEPLFAGAISSGQLSASGAVSLTTSGSTRLEALPIHIQQQPESSNRKRAAASQNITGAATGLYYNENNLNLTIVAGHFTARATNGSTINNLLIINSTDNDRVNGLTGNLVQDSTFLALETHGTALFAGGEVSGRINGNDVNGLVVYDLRSNTLVDPQPSSLQGPNVVVNAIASRPDSSSVYVAGDFQSAGSLTCPAVCIYDTSLSQWSSPATGLSGSVAALTWASSNKLVVGGNLTVQGNATTMATYDVRAGTYTVIPGANALPGPVTALCAANEDTSSFWVAGKATNGTAFLEKYDGSRWTSVGDILGSGTTIRGLQVLSVSRNHGGTDLLEDDQVLMVMGQIEVAGFGSASAALFNGTTFAPFILANTANNQPGSLAQAFVQNPGSVFRAGGHHLAVGFVVLIGLAVALGLVFLLVLLGIIMERYRRKRQGYVPAPTQVYDKDSNIQRIPPEDLLGTIGHTGSPGPRI